ncbi:hypothetical protein SOVF_210860 [Spinacia oleracea]|nr:hypothetical protein SOVF_210860 [Spinacia oleracea]
MKLHWTCAGVLDENLQQRGISVFPAGESFEPREGLKQEIHDHTIVWPPMALIMNTLPLKDLNDK